MTSTRLHWMSAKEAYLENVLKCIKETLKKEKLLSKTTLSCVVPARPLFWPRSWFRCQHSAESDEKYYSKLLNKIEPNKKYTILILLMFFGVLNSFLIGIIFS